MNESIRKAIDCCGFARGNLQTALSESNEVEGIVLLDLIGRATRLQSDIEALLNAHNGDADRGRELSQIQYVNPRRRAKKK